MPSKHLIVNKIIWLPASHNLFYFVMKIIFKKNYLKLNMSNTFKPINICHYSTFRILKVTLLINLPLYKYKKFLIQYDLLASFEFL